MTIKIRGEYIMKNKIKDPLTEAYKRARNLELDIKISTGHAVLKQNNNIEIIDVNELTIEDLEYLIKEAKSFIEYKEKSKL